MRPLIHRSLSSHSSVSFEVDPTQCACVLKETYTHADLVGSTVCIERDLYTRY